MLGVVLQTYGVLASLVPEQTFARHHEGAFLVRQSHELAAIGPQR